AKNTARRDEAVKALNEAAEALRNTIAEINAAIEEKVNPAIEAYNEALMAATEFRDEIVSDMETYADERSDKWREGDAGSNYESWKGEWEGIDLGELNAIEEIEEPDLSHAESIEQLPEQPEE